MDTPRPAAADTAAQICQRLVSQAQQNVDDILRALRAESPGPGSPLTPAEHDTFQRRWTGLAEVLVDPRTGLTSRILFWDRLLHTHLRWQRYGTPFAVLYVGLPDADERGVPEVAARLSARLRATDTVAYAGSAEFTILLDLVQSPDEAVAVAERIQGDLSTPASIGIAAVDDRGMDGGTVLWEAYRAMRKSRDAGEARIEVFTAAPA